MGFKDAIRNYLEQQNTKFAKYPNRRKEIHKTACQNCPAVINKKYGIIDPEFEDIKNESREVHLQSVFQCGWRISKLCKGYCDELNITETDLAICTHNPD